MSNKDIISNTNVDEFEFEELTFKVKQSPKEDCGPDCDPNEHGCDPFDRPCDPGQADCPPQCYPSDDCEPGVEDKNDLKKSDYSKKPRP